MAGEAENVIINFVGETSGLAPIDDALDVIVQKGDAVGDVWRKTAAEMGNANKQNTETTNKLAKSIDQLALATKSADKAVIGGAYKNYLKELQAQLGLTQKELVAYVQNARKAAQEGIFEAGTDQEIAEISVGIEVMNEQLKEFGETEEGTGERTESLRAQLTEAKQGLFEMAEAGKAGTKEFEALKKKAGDLKDKMSDLNAVVQGVGSDTKNLDGLISLASGAAAGFAVAKGAAALFGTKSEEVQEALLKLNAAMSILQGLQQIQNVLQKESAAMLLLQSGRTTALALGQQFLAATTLETAAATAVLRTALIASGIGAVVVLIGLAAAALSSMGDEAENAALNFDALDNSMERLSRNLDQLRGKIDLNGKLQLEYLKQRGASDQKITDQEIQNLKYVQSAHKDAADEKIELANKVFAANGATIRGTIATAEDAYTAIDKINNKLTSSAFKDATDAQKEGLKKGVEYLTAAAKSLEEGEKIQGEIVVKGEEFKTESIEKANQKRKENAEKQREADERSAKALSEIRIRQLQEEADFLKGQSEDPEALISVRIASLQGYYFKLTAINEEQEAQEKNKRGLTAAEVRNIEDKYFKERLHLATDFYVGRNLITKEGNEKLDQDAQNFASNQLANEKRIHEGTVAAIADIYKNLSLKNARNQDKDLDDIKTLYDQGVLSLEEYEKRKKQIIDKYIVYNLSNKKAEIEAQISAEKYAGNDTTALQEQLLVIKQQLRDRDDQSHKESLEKQKSDLEIWVAENQEIIQAAFQIIDAGLNIIFENSRQRREAALAEELAGLDESKSKELNNKNITEQQKADIERRYKQRENQVKTQAFNAEKDEKKKEAIIQGALNVLKAFPNPILMGLAGLLTLAQVAQISSQEPPRFRHGKVDIDGPGTTTSDSIPAMLSRRESVINANSTAKWKDHLQAMNDDRYESFLTKYLHSFVFPAVPDYVTTTSAAPQIDYKMLAREMASELSSIMPAPAQVHNHFDKDGHTAYIVTAGGRLEIKNENTKFS